LINFNAGRPLNFCYFVLMSTVVLSLFGDEIIPEQINAVGKSRAARKPKVEPAKKEAEPETVENEVVQAVTAQEVAEVTELVQEVPTPQPIEEEPAKTPEIIKSAHEVPISAPHPTQEALAKAREVMRAAHETPVSQSTPEESLKGVEEIQAVRETAMSAPLLIPEVPARIVKASEVTKVEEKKRKPATKKEKPAAKKTAVKAVKKEIVKREKPEARAILEGWTPDKQYYSIGEVAGLFYVATSHIRFWTNEFALKVRTTRKGDRLYSPEQINELRTIYHLVKEKGYTIAGAKARLKDAKKTPVQTLDLKQSLLQLRNKLVDIKNQL
jgi:DNA-binding transcriptional MerR regulator